MVCNFFARLENEQVKKIPLTQAIIPTIQAIFINGGSVLFTDTEQIEFDGNYNTAENEVLYVPLSLPVEITQAAANPLGTPDLDLTTDHIKTLFWYENEVYYFQTFDKRKLLINRSVLFLSDQTYNQLDENAFIVDEVVNAVHRDGRFYFTSYANANKIFSLSEFYREATDAEIETFAHNRNIAIDQKWFMENTNSTIRKQITLLQRSQTLRNADTKKIKTDAKKFSLAIDLDKKGKIKFPNDKKSCSDILLFLNEQYWIGLISGTKFKTNSKREVKIPKVAKLKEAKI